MSELTTYTLALGKEALNCTEFTLLSASNFKDIPIEVVLILYILDNHHMSFKVLFLCLSFLGVLVLRLLYACLKVSMCRLE